jgi:hypothetical protein
MRMAMLLVSGGAFDQLSGGEVDAPSQVNSEGID